MTVYWVDIEDANGVKQGFGPIASAQAWTHTAALDRAGTFSFTMPADDPRRNNLAVKRIARCWTYDGGELRHLGAGIINDISLRLDAEGAPVLTVSGDDLLHELTYRNVGELELLDEVAAHPAEVFYVPATTNPAEPKPVDSGDDLTDRTWLDYLNDNNLYDTTSWHLLDWMMRIRWTVVKDPHPFKGMTFTLPNFNYLSTSYELDYWNSDDEWASLTAAASHPTPWGATTYTLTWDVPTDWAIRAGEAGYKVRFKPDDCTNGISISDCMIVYDRPSVDALEKIIGYAPTGWSLDAANGYPSIARATELGANLITNGTFEAYTGTPDNGSEDTFTGWTNSGAIGGTVEASTTAHAGSAAVKVTVGATYDNRRVYQDVTVDAGTDYMLSLWSRGDGTRAGVYLIGTSGGNDHALTPVASTGNATTNWQQTWVELRTPPGVTSMRLEFYGPWYLTTGTAWWDDISLRARTGGEVALKFANESTLEALIRVAETTGEHFILSPSGRQVLWLRNDVRSSGVRCVGNTDPQAVEDEPDIALLVNVTESQSAYDLVSRVYPFGGGQGDERATLANCTRGVPDGYTLDTTNNCLIRTASETAYGRIDRRLDLPDIVALNQSQAQLEYASNMLFDRAYTYLRRHSATSTALTAGDVPRAYNLTLAKCDRVLLPGYTVRVEYETWYNQTRQLSINRDMWILSSTVRVDETGIHTVALQCATTDTPPMTDAMLLADMLRKQRASFAHAPGV